MRIAVISDTHNRLPPQLLPRIAGADEIWHLGDVCAPAITAELAQLGKPLHVVLGNNDFFHGWPLTLKREIAGARCHLVHIPPPIAPPDCDLLLHGHTHIPRDETLGATRWLNPGAITFPKGGSAASFAWLTFEDGQPPMWKIMPL